MSNNSNFATTATTTAAQAGSDALAQGKAIFERFAHTIAQQRQDAPLQLGEGCVAIATALVALFAKSVRVWGYFELSVLDCLGLNSDISRIGGSGDASIGILGILLVAGVVCSAITAFMCLTRKDDSSLPTSWGMAAYALVAMMIICNLGSQAAGMVAIGGGVWLTLLGGIACGVLDLMRAGKISLPQE